MKAKKRIKHIVKWIKNYAYDHKIQKLVVGVSGGIDSAVVSTLCAHTGIPTIVLSMPIHQSEHTHNLSRAHCEWLVENFSNVQDRTFDLTTVFDEFNKLFVDHRSDLAFANSRSRLRMVCLYQVAQSENGIVVGTGNLVEDFGVGFFTKYGDGGVDISPIGNCLKTEVWKMGSELGVLLEIIDAAPTDGLWDDQRTDEDQLGMSYRDLERMMEIDTWSNKKILESVTPEDLEKLLKYRVIRRRNLHKMTPIPVCMFDK